MTRLKEIIFEEVLNINNKYLFLSKVETSSIYRQVTDGLKAYEVYELKELVVEMCQHIMIQRRKNHQGATGEQILMFIR
jgi:hypothetical protein